VRDERKLFTLCSFRLISPAESAQSTEKTRTRREIKSAQNSFADVSFKLFLEILATTYSNIIPPCSAKSAPVVRNGISRVFILDFKRESMSIAPIYHHTSWRRYVLHCTCNYNRAKSYTIVHNIECLQRRFIGCK